MNSITKGVIAALVGAVAVTFIDRMLGVNLSDIGSVASITHSLTYMVWGAAVYHFSM